MARWAPVTDAGMPIFSNRQISGKVHIVAGERKLEPRCPPEESGHIHSGADGLRDEVRGSSPRQVQRREPPPTENQERTQYQMANSGDGSRLQRRHAVPRRLKRSGCQPLESHYRHGEELKPHISAGLCNHLVSQPHQPQQRIGEDQPERHQQDRVGRRQRDGLEHDVVGVTNLPCADCARDHRSHTGVQSHPSRHQHHQKRLSDTQPSDRLEADPARPNQVGELIHDAQEAFGDLRPGQEPQVARDAACCQVLRDMGCPPRGPWRSLYGRRLLVWRPGVPFMWGFCHKVRVRRRRPLHN